MRRHTQRGTEILGQRANVGPLLHTDLYLQDAPAHRAQRTCSSKLVNLHRSGGTLHLLTRTGTLVERLPVNLQCRVHGWNLLECPGQRYHRLCHCI